MGGQHNLSGRGGAASAEDSDGNGLTSRRLRKLTQGGERSGRREARTGRVEPNRHAHVHGVEHISRQRDDGLIHAGSEDYRSIFCSKPRVRVYEHRQQFRRRTPSGRCETARLALRRCLAAAAILGFQLLKCPLQLTCGGRDERVRIGMEKNER